jgi:hypothetical protein
MGIRKGAPDLETLSQDRTLEFRGAEGIVLKIEHREERKCQETKLLCLDKRQTMRRKEKGGTSM